MNSKRSPYIQPNASAQIDNYPKHTAEATTEFFKASVWNVMQWPSQLPDLIEHAVHLRKAKVNALPSCSESNKEVRTLESWQSIANGNPASDDVHAFHTLGCNLVGLYNVDVKYPSNKVDNPKLKPICLFNL